MKAEPIPVKYCGGPKDGLETVAEFVADVPPLEFVEPTVPVDPDTMYHVYKRVLETGKGAPIERVLYVYLGRRQPSGRMISVIRGEP